MSAIRHLFAFACVYLPLTWCAGLLIGAFAAPGMSRNLAYESFLWFVLAVQLLLPTLLALAFTNGALFCARRVLRRRKHAIPVWLRMIAVGIALPATQATVWGGHGPSVEFLVVAVFPAAVLGAIAPDAAPQARPSKADA